MLTVPGSENIGGPAVASETHYSQDHNVPVQCTCFFEVFGSLLAGNLDSCDTCAGAGIMAASSARTPSDTE